MSFVEKLQCLQYWELSYQSVCFWGFVWISSFHKQFRFFIFFLLSSSDVHPDSKTIHQQTYKKPQQFTTPREKPLKEVLYFNPKPTEQSIQYSCSLLVLNLSKMVSWMTILTKSVGFFLDKRPCLAKKLLRNKQKKKRRAYRMENRKKKGTKFTFRFSFRHLHTNLIVKIVMELPSKQENITGHFLLPFRKRFHHRANINQRKSKLNINWLPWWKYLGQKVTNFGLGTDTKAFWNT